ncbi:2-dehydropantoate 2-reductase [Sutcliffiella halmapala]|uniref:2-dehydropantoate 2-reductase n=1 Tax=Sutcliffiella halmapala TaxID=79882 RepID=UPI001475A2F2|nr:2-dehydropantoate 2-reductase [Sutcliffiella halmapala]
MRIGIIGAGAIGLFYAYQFSAAFPVTIYVRRTDQLVQLQEKAIRLLDNNQVLGERSVSVKLLHKEDTLIEDVIVVAVKQYALDDIMSSLLNLRDHQTILFLQNGMAHLELVKNITSSQVILGVVEHGVKKEDDVTVKWTGKGSTKIAGYSGASTDSLFIEKWKQELSGNFPIQICLNFENMLKEKLIVNAIINPLTSLYNVKNGVLLSNPSFQETMKSLYDEIAFLVPEESKIKMWEHIQNICQKTAENWSSMQRDLEQARETEVDAILGYIIFLAQQKGINVPLTEFLYKSIKGLESNNRKF